MCLLVGGRDLGSGPSFQTGYAGPIPIARSTSLRSGNRPRSLGKPRVVPTQSHSLVSRSGLQSTAARNLPWSRTNTGMPAELCATRESLVMSGWPGQTRRTLRARLAVWLVAPRWGADRLDPELRAALAARADADDATVSEVIRQALRAWLHVA